MIKINQILVPTDFSEHARHALNYAVELSREFGATIHLLHVCDDINHILADPSATLISISELVEEQERLANAELNELAATVPEGIEVLPRIKMQAPVVGILKYAEDHDIDLIILGTHGRTGMAHLVLGSVAERVVRQASCPVLVVRPREHEFISPD